MSTYNTEEVNHLIRNRRTIYPEQYSDKPVPEDIINTMLENANWAPNHGGTEPWRFRVYAGAGKAGLLELQERLYRENTNPETFRQDKLDKLLMRGEKAQYIIAITMKRDPRGKIRAIEEVEAVACAVQNMHLTATAYGVGAFWSTGGLTYIDDAKPHFNVEGEDELLGFMYVGYPSIDWPKGRRKPINDKVEWVR